MEKRAQFNFMPQCTNEREEIETDVLIVGGGLVGSCLAAALATTPLRVCVIDFADPQEALSKRFDGRASAVSLSNQRLLEGVGLWEMLKDSSAPILDIRVSDGSSLLFLHYDHRAVGEEPMGFMVENYYFKRALYTHLENKAGVATYSPVFVTQLKRDSAGVKAVLSDGRKVRARLVVGADGRNSEMRKSCGIGLTSWKYNQTAIICTVQHARSHNYTAQERFLPSGPFAILPLHGEPKEAANRSSIVWTEREAVVPSLMALEDKDFVVELACRFGTFLGDIKVISPLYTHPLNLQFAERSTDHRLVLIGDASHSMHPIAGQGLNMGLRDAAALAEVLVDAYRLGLDIGDDVVLKRYSKWRRFDNTMMIAATDVLNRLFSNNIVPLRLARDAGLGIVDSIQPLKRQFMRHAMGLVGDLPKLLRGAPL